jgi:hypothetical protein
VLPLPLHGRNCPEQSWWKLVCGFCAAQLLLRLLVMQHVR